MFCKFVLTIMMLVTFNVLAMVDLPALTGRYGHYDIVAYTGKFLGPIKLRSLVISYGLTDFYIENGELLSKDRFCFSEYIANIPFNSKTSDEFTQAIIPEPVALKVKEVDGAIKIFRPETPTLLGVALESYLDPFPVDPNSPAYIVYIV